MCQVGAVWASWMGRKPDPTPELNPQDHGLPPYPTGEVVGACVCGSWPGGECLRCPVIPAARLTATPTAGRTE
jgi:hypothetical protein